MVRLTEIDIGYAPDCGSTCHLARMPGDLGLYLALTGDALKGDDVFLAGLAFRHIKHPETARIELREKCSTVEKILVRNY